jgi:amino acid transporter
MTSLLGSLGADQSAIDWCASTTGVLVIASLVNVWGFFIVIMGLRMYNWNQRIIMFIAFATLIVTGIVLTTASHADFVSAYDEQALADGSLSYNNTISAVRDAGYDISTTAKPGMDLGATLALFPAIAWATAYGYQITFICGEVKRPQRNIVLGQVLAAVIPMVFLIWFSWGLVNVMHQDFLGAVAVIDNDGLDAFTLSTGSNTYSMISLLTDNSIAQFCIGSVFIWFNLLCMPISYIAFSRAAFAWGMDRLGPMWFTDVSPRWHSPVKNNVVMLVMSEIGILIYAYWAEAIDAVAIVALEAMSAWGVMAVSGLLFPYVKKARTIWEASPYKFRLGPIYMLTIFSIVNLTFVGILIYYFFTVPALGAISTWGAIVYVVIWIFGVLWYLLWIQHWKKQGIDLKLAWKELPPA